MTSNDLNLQKFLQFSLRLIMMFQNSVNFETDFDSILYHKYIYSDIFFCLSNR